MFEVIPLTNYTPEAIKSIVNNTIFICGIDTYKSICNYNNYPIRNKRIAILNMLSFIQHLNAKTFERTTITMSSSIFRKIFTGAKYRAYIDILAELNIITRVPYKDGKFFDYGENRRYCQYRIHNSYLLDKSCIVLVNQNKPLKLVTDKKYPAKFTNAIRETKCDYKEAISEEILNYTLTGMKDSCLRARLSRLFALNNERFIKQGEKVDRIYHSFSNLSKISRKYLYIKSKKYHDIDIKNCQPLLLCYLLRKLEMKIDVDYIEACEKGVIYEQFITDLIDRDNVKVELYSTIFFDFKPKRVIAQKFKDLYPLTYDSLSILHNSETTLASQLQNIEASIFNQIKPQKSKYYFTLFDAIYFTDQRDFRSITEQIKKQFSVYSLFPSTSTSIASVIKTPPII